MMKTLLFLVVALMKNEAAYGLNVPNFCSECGSSKVVAQVPSGDERLRAVCTECGYVAYVNPKVVVGCVVRCPENHFVLGRRSIEPRLGTWGNPQGFMELGETTRECAARETLEEVGIALDPTQLSLLALYNLPSQVQLVYEANILVSSHATCTKECSEIKLFSSDDLPSHDQLAFPTVHWALQHAIHRRSSSHIQQRTKFYDGTSWQLIDDDLTASEEEVHR